MRFFTSIRLALLGIWLGAACFFIVVAQSAFAILPAREMAGAIVNRTLAILNYGGLAIAVLLIIMSLVGMKTAAKFWVWVERFLLLIVAGACAVGQFVIAQWLMYLRLEMNKPIDEFAMDDPLRLQFNQFHQYSVWALTAAMIAALLAFFIISNRKFAAKTKAADDLTLPNDFKI
jgi:hypothetical protein